VLPASGRDTGPKRGSKNGVHRMVHIGQEIEGKRCRVNQLALCSGPGGRRFKSSLPDQSFQIHKLYFWFFVYKSVVDSVGGEILRVQHSRKTHVRLTAHKSVCFSDYCKFSLSLTDGVGIVCLILDRQGLPHRATNVRVLLQMFLIALRKNRHG